MTDSTPVVPNSYLPFSPAIVAGDFIFVSGQASVDESGAIVVDSFAGEFERSMNNVRRILEAAGAGMEQIVQVRAYLGNMAYRDEFNAQYLQYFASPHPARTTIGCDIAGLKFEVDVVAYVGDRPVRAIS